MRPAAIRRAGPALLLATLALALVAPSATAHSETISQSQSFEVGPYVVALTPDPMPMYANVTPQAFRLEVVNASTNLYAQVSAHLTLVGPNAFEDTLTFESASARYYLAHTTLTQRGNHTATLVIEDGTGEHELETTFLVYPDMPFRIRPVDPSYDVIPGARSVLAYEIVDPVTLARKDAFASLDMRIEHWSSDHATLLDEKTIALRNEGVGLWKIEHVFDAGHYYLRFASQDGGFNYADLPLLHVNVLPPVTNAGDSDENATPAAAAPLALVAIAIVALARRRK